MLPNGCRMVWKQQMEADYQPDAIKIMSELAAEHYGVAFEDLPYDWRCPRCKQPKEKFNKA